jgi:hypothetical protein
MSFKNILTAKIFKECIAFLYCNFVLSFCDEIKIFTYFLRLLLSQIRTGFIFLTNKLTSLARTEADVPHSIPVLPRVLEPS